MDMYEFLRLRGVTRLCHFTKLRGLTHILSSGEGILASSSIRSDIKDMTDTERYDGELEYICCSVEYPNSWFLDRAKRENRDKIFKDWCVLYLDLNILKSRDAKCCPCNASTQHGRYIGNSVGELFADTVSCKRTYTRTREMLDCCPTDGQAEILIKDNIPRECITGITVGNEEEAEMVYAMMKTLGVSLKPIYIAPTILTPEWSDIIHRGERPCENLCVWEEE